MPIVEGRDFKERAFTVGIGGYVPSSNGCHTRTLLTQRFPALSAPARQP
jgi:hypothetical protein